MKIGIHFLIYFLLLLSFPSIAKTGFVNTMRAFEQTHQGKAVKARLEKESKKAQSELTKLESQLKKEEESLKKEVALLSEQAKNAKLTQFQRRVFEFQKKAKDEEIRLQNLQKELMDPILNRLKVVIGDVAKKAGYSVVKNIGNDILWVSANLDLTDQVYTAYNKKYKRKI
ncbi:MAG: OmpH family outer membrane protein [Bdellovibrionales bacterium]|nr:OmpH family outer membrane protein [Bdellovibrionales bacterium]